MAKYLTGKVALVTGGSRGIGAAIARRLAEDGANVAITYASARDKADEVARDVVASGGRGLAIRADSADAKAVRSAVDETARTLGRIDILVNNAGTAVLAPIDQLSLADFDRMVAINLRGVFVAIQESIKHMGEGGRVITIGSVNADRVPFAGAAAYAMTKAGIAGLTKGLARDLGPRGITVNAVQPGPVDTDLNPDNGEFATMLKGLMALPRYGRSEEVAGMVAYLASAEAAFVTGACLNIDGGFGA